LAINGKIIKSNSMKKWIFITFVAFAACNSDETNSTNANVDSVRTDSLAVATQSGENCYAWAIGKDTATLFIKSEDTVVTGDLQYKWAEKDNSNGMLKGAKRGDLIVAYYTFVSEGKTSVRQVVFRTQGVDLVEGYGDVVTIRDTVQFKNIDKLQYQDDRAFIKGICAEK